MDSSASKASKHCPTTFHIVFLDSHSEWSKHINSAIGKWSAIGASSNLSLGKSAIICSPTLPLSLRHVIHLNMADLTTQLPQITQKPKHLISFKVIPLPLWAVLLWYIAQSDQWPGFSLAILLKLTFITESWHFSSFTNSDNTMFVHKWI